MLRTIDLNDESRISAQEINFHSAPAVERNGRVGELVRHHLGQQIDRVFPAYTPGGALGLLKT